MKPLANADLLKSPTLIKISALLLLTVASFYLGKHWSNDSYHQLLFFFFSSSSSTSSTSIPKISISPNSNKAFNLSAIIPSNYTTSQPIPIQIPSVVTETEANLPPPPPLNRSFGVVDENGVMSDDFEVGEEVEIVEDWGNQTEILELESDDGESKSSAKFRIKKFGMCPESMREYIPCLDNADAIKKLESTERGEKFERHCPEKDNGLNCLVPPPNGYRQPIPWSRSRDEVLFLCLQSEPVLTIAR